MASMKRLNLDQLRAFLSVVRLGSFSRAATALNLTQPAVTTRIKNLEKSVGIDLFERSSTGIRLTKRGFILMRYAEQIEHVSERIAEEVMDPSGIEGLLRIGVSETIAQTWLPDLVAECHAMFPNVEIEINVDISINLREDLLNREIDLAILLGPVSEFSVTNSVLPDFALAWYAPVDPLAERGMAETLYGLPVISYARNTRPFRELKAALSERLNPHVSMFPSSSLSACFRLVEAGLGVAALPSILGRDFVKAGRIREFDPGWTPNPLQFTASHIAEPKNHLVETAARTAQMVAAHYAAHKYIL